MVVNGDDDAASLDPMPTTTCFVVTWRQILVPVTPSAIKPTNHGNYEDAASVYGVASGEGSRSEIHPYFDGYAEFKDKTREKTVLLFVIDQIICK